VVHRAQDRVHRKPPVLVRVGPDLDETRALADLRQEEVAIGAEAGDVLRAVAAVLAGSVRLVDTVGRSGADEFLLVAPGSAGAAVAKRVLEGIAELPAVNGQPVTIATGVARFPSDGTDAESVLAAAQAALDRTRSSGRGQVEATEPTTGS